MLKFKILMATLVVSALSVSALAREKNLEDAVQKLDNIVNNSIPAKYRDQLNAAIDELITAAEKQCSAADPSQGSKRSDCDIAQGAYGGYIVVQNNLRLSSLAQTSILYAKKDLDQMISVGVCKAGSISAPCTIEAGTYGGYVVKRNELRLTSLAHTSVVDAGKERLALIAAGICE